MRSFLSLLLLLGCSDYELTAEETGALRVSPAEVTLDGACAYEERTLTLESVGEFAVDVFSVRVEGEGWAILESPALPTSLEPGSSLEVTVLGNQGDAVLLVETDDPEGATKSIPLTGSANDAPVVTWASPGEGGVVEPGDSLVVSVGDDHDAPEDLVVAWSSDVDGDLGLANGDADGQSAVPWADGSGGDHTLTATVTDTCGASSSATVEICHQAGYRSDNLDLSTWALGGSARFDADNGWVELTNVAGTFQAGSAFQTTPTTGNHVKLAFAFYASGGTGADGFAVTALDTERASAYMAQSGGCLGYGGGGVCGAFEPLYGWTVEMDTFFSAGLDPTEEDHVSFHFDGDVAGYEVYAAVPDMEDDAWHEMVIEVEAPRVTVSIDGVVYIDADIEGYFDFPAEVGFTAATGGETNYHRIDALQVIEDLCPSAE